MMRHAPTRHGLMQSATHHTATGEKYRETAKPPTDTQISAHLAGQITVAVPACANGLAATIVIDVDDNGFSIVPALIAAAEKHGLWAWGELHEDTDRGYVYIPFAALVNAAALKQLGDVLIAEAGFADVPAAMLDNRTANQAITRLPFGIHRQTMRRGLIIFQDGTSYDLNTALDAGLAAWRDRYHENAALVPAAPPAYENAPAPRTATKC